eukprot:COSAG03_NODE_7193_length_951_cov_1.869718_1_plen_88_part_00
MAAQESATAEQTTDGQASGNVDSPEDELLITNFDPDNDLVALLCPVSPVLGSGGHDVSSDCGDRAAPLAPVSPVLGAAGLDVYGDIL